MSKQKPVVETQGEVFPVDDVVEAEAELMDEPVEQVDENFHIEISHKLIGGEPVNAVSARELHAKLGSKQDFSTWIKNRIEKYGFIENMDFVTLHKKVERQILIEYFISLDMAKELSMVENNEQGKRARRYFIECEKVAKAGRGEATQQTISGKPLEQPEAIDWTAPAVLNRFAVVKKAPYPTI